MNEHTTQVSRVMIVDDHPIVRHGLAQLIQHESDLTVCMQASNIDEARRAVADSMPDILIVDLSLGNESGLDLIKDLKGQHPEIRILVLSMHDETFYADRALQAGAMGYIMKHEPPDRVIDAIRRILDGEVYLSSATSSSLLGRMVGRKNPPAASPVEVLSDRELQVLGLIGKGLKSRDIANTLNLSVKTVDSHRERIKAKLNLPNGMALLQFAIRREIEGE